MLRRCWFIIKLSVIVVFDFDIVDNKQRESCWVPYETKNSHTDEIFWILLCCHVQHVDKIFEYFYCCCRSSKDSHHFTQSSFVAFSLSAISLVFWGFERHSILWHKPSITPHSISTVDESQRFSQKCLWSNYPPFYFLAAFINIS